MALNEPWTRAETLAALLAIDPTGLGGVTLRAGPGPARDTFLRVLKNLMPRGEPWRRLPPGTAEGRLLGGLDLAATLAAGRPVAERGLLAACDGGVLIAPMAERLAADIVGPLAATLDTGTASGDAARFTLVMLDEGIADERAPAALIERLAFLLNLDDVRPDHEALHTPDEIAAARARLGSVLVDDHAVEALCVAGLALGVGSLRASTFALRVARAAAALDDSATIEDTHLALAAALVFAPRATMLPASDADDQQHPDDDRPDDAEQASDEPPPEQPEPEATSETDAMTETAGLSDKMVEAAKAAIPADLLAALQANAGARRHASAGKSGIARPSGQRGRPAGVRRGMPGRGARLALVETLRAAAPWQMVRRRPRDSDADSESLRDTQRFGRAPLSLAEQSRESGRCSSESRVIVNREDFRVARYKDRSETTTIFVVDASGSAALNRLAEVKGAVELILAECYVRRDSVALIAFRGTKADLLLPPTRSLARAKRALAGQPGGGGTPLATAIDAAVSLSDAIRRKGPTPLAVFLTDGRANIGRDGRPGRAEAEADALTAARGIRGLGLACLLVDISPRPNPAAQALAVAMAARYQPLPYVDARVLSRAVLEAATT